MQCRLRYLLDFDLKIRSGQVCNILISYLALLTLTQEGNSVTHIVRTRILSNGYVHLAPQLLLAINWCPRRNFLLSVIAHRIGLYANTDFSSVSISIT